MTINGIRKNIKNFILLEKILLKMNMEDLVVIENDENPMLPKEEMKEFRKIIKELQKEIFLLKNKL